MPSGPLKPSSIVRHIKKHEAEMEKIDARLEEVRKELAALVRKRSLLRKTVKGLQARLDLLSKPGNEWMLRPEPTYEDL